MTELRWKTGFEIELLAPKGASRRDLAVAIAKKNSGRVWRCFYAQSEPSAVPGMSVFENLILGFDALDNDGMLLARCVDDLTIQADLDQDLPGLPGWYRIVSDDARLLRLIMAQCNADEELNTVLEPIAKLFGTEITKEADDLVRLADAMSAPIALASGLPGERERPCELITPPLETNHLATLTSLLEPAIELGFTVPREAAVHIHFDAIKLCNPRVFARLVQVTKLHGPGLRKLVGTNLYCKRLAATPTWLWKETRKAAFEASDWLDASEALRARELSKYCDFNFLNLVHNVPGKSTFEVRILPGSMAAEEIIEQAVLFEAILNWCLDAPRGTAPASRLSRFIEQLDLSPKRKARWRQAAAGHG